MKVTVVKVLHRGYNSTLNKYVAFVQVRVNGAYRGMRLFRQTQAEVDAIDVGTIVEMQ